MSYLELKWELFGRNDNEGSEETIAEIEEN
jgi:hypothetical protein